MRTTIMLGTLIVLVTGCVACSSQNSRVVVGTEARNHAASADGKIAFHQVDHSTWDHLLQKYVDRDGMVDYAAWKASQADRDALKQYLTLLSSADPNAETSQEGRLAFWINAYNALTLQGILDVYPTSSIRNHTAKLVGYNIWDDLLLPVADREYSLNQIEHEILRKLSEPRIHFAIVCASIGCPRLLNEAYTPENLERQLTENTRDFFTRSKNFEGDLAGRRVRVSAILDWFGEDFGSTPQKGLAKLAPYLPGEATQQLIASEDYSVSYLEYDWSLNEQ